MVVFLVKFALLLVYTISVSNWNAAGRSFISQPCDPIIQLRSVKTKFISDALETGPGEDLTGLWHTDDRLTNGSCATRNCSRNQDTILQQQWSARVRKQHDDVVNNSRSRNGFAFVLFGLARTMHHVELLDNFQDILHKLVQQFVTVDVFWAVKPEIYYPYQREYFSYNMALNSTCLLAYFSTRLPEGVTLVMANASQVAVADQRLAMKIGFDAVQIREEQRGALYQYVAALRPDVHVTPELFSHLPQLVVLSFWDFGGIAHRPLAEHFFEQYRTWHFSSADNGRCFYFLDQVGKTAMVGDELQNGGYNLLAYLHSFIEGVVVKRNFDYGNWRIVRPDNQTLPQYYRICPPRK